MTENVLREYATTAQVARNIVSDIGLSATQADMLTEAFSINGISTMLELARLSGEPEREIRMFPRDAVKQKDHPFVVIISA